MTAGNFYMVYGDGQRAPVCKHPNIDTAKREAERLARHHHGVSFFVMMPIIVATRIDVETRELVDLSTTGVPF